LGGERYIPHVGGDFDSGFGGYGERSRSAKWGSRMFMVARKRRSLVLHSGDGEVLVCETEKREIRNDIFILILGV